MADVDSLLRLFDALGAERGVVYISCPITGGPRLVALARSLGCTTADVLLRDPESYETAVLRPNERDAHELAEEVRTKHPAQLVLDPSRVHFSDWAQADYNSFWKRVIERFVSEVVLAPGWAFSNGARSEVSLCIRLGLPIRNSVGTPLDDEVLQSMMEAADVEVATVDSRGVNSPWLVADDV